MKMNNLHRTLTALLSGMSLLVMFQVLQSARLQSLEFMKERAPFVTKRLDDEPAVRFIASDENEEDDLNPTFAKVYSPESLDGHWKIYAFESIDGVMESYKQGTDEEFLVELYLQSPTEVLLVDGVDEQIWDIAFFRDDQNPTLIRIEIRSKIVDESTGELIGYEKLFARKVIIEDIETQTAREPIAFKDEPSKSEVQEPEVAQDTELEEKFYEITRATDPSNPDVQIGHTAVSGSLSMLGSTITGLSVTLKPGSDDSLEIDLGEIQVENNTFTERDFSGVVTRYPPDQVTITLIYSDKRKVRLVFMDQSNEIFFKPPVEEADFVNQNGTQVFSAESKFNVTQENEVVDRFQASQPNEETQELLLDQGVEF